MAKGGYLSWNPLNWFKSAEEPSPIAIAETPAAPVGGPYGGKKHRKSKSKTRRIKKSRSKTGRKH